MALRLRRLSSSRIAHTALLMALTATLAVMSGSESEWRTRLRDWLFDHYNEIHPRPPGDHAVIIDIDEDSLRVLGQWPWPRDVRAKLLLRLQEYGASSVAFDGVDAEPDRTSPARVLERAGVEIPPETSAKLNDHDALFVQAIRDTGIYVTGLTEAEWGHNTLPQNTRAKIFAGKGLKRDDFLMQVPRRRGLAVCMPEISASAAGEGSFIAIPDADGIIRKAPLFITYPSRDELQPDGKVLHPKLYPFLALEALRVSLKTKIGYFLSGEQGKFPWHDGPSVTIGGKVTLPVMRDGKFLIWFAPHQTQRNKYISAWKILAPGLDAELKRRIEGKIVFIGTSAEGLRDIRSTPIDTYIPGVEVHVNVVEQILAKQFLFFPEYFRGLEFWVILLSGLAIAIITPISGMVTINVLTGAAVASGYFVAQYAYQRHGLLVDVVYPSLSLLAVAFSASVLTWLRTEGERRSVKQAFGLYISPDFMTELTRNPDKLKLGGELRDLTVMFTDIRNFTTLSERMSPEALIQLMNDFLTPMADRVMAHRGTIDKFMGDAMMAFWNAPLDDADHARNACRAALAMSAALAPVNERLSAEAGDAPLVLRAGIGINTGPAAVGNMGSKQRFAYSALGDTVNLASRLEGQTKGYGVDILIGEQTRAQAADFATLELDLLRVKGKTKPVRVFALLGDEALAADPAFQSWAQAHADMLAAYRSRDFTGAQDALAVCREKDAGGKLSACYELYAERITELLRTPPAADWDGVFTATSK